MVKRLVVESLTNWAWVVWQVKKKNQTISGRPFLKAGLIMYWIWLQNKQDSKQLQ
jgi:hypothetical protein